MTNKKHLFALLAAFTFTAAAHAQVTVDGAWIRATVPQQTSTGAFMQLQSAREARLVAAHSPVAGRVELHKMQMDGHTMRMHAVDGIDLPAGASVNLASGGYHIMLLGLKRQIKAGERVPLTLVVQGRDGKRESVAVEAPVRPLTFVAPKVPGHGGH